MAANSSGKIDLNTAEAHILTQLPGISKTVAYHIVNHRQRHGYFTAWEELKEVKDSPVDSLGEIKQRAVLGCSPKEDCLPPRHSIEHHLERELKKPEGNTRRLRTTKGPKKAHDSASHRPH